MNILKADSKIIDTVINGTTDHASCRSENEELADEKMSMEKCMNLTREFISTLEKQDCHSKIAILQFHKI